MRLGLDTAAPVGLAMVCSGVLLAWVIQGRTTPAAPRLPIDHPAAMEPSASAEPIVPRWQAGPGEPGQDRGHWPGFRGPHGEGWIEPALELARDWPASGPPVLWGIDAGEGYAAPAVANGRVYLIDYDADAQADALRCLSLDDGREIWRKSYPVSIKRSHGMSRTVPAVADDTVVSIGPKCHVLAVDATSGELKWFLDMVQRFGTRVPPWYAGQCPLIDDGRVILAPVGPEVLMAALDLHSGDILWTAPNPMGWSMTHVSIVPMEFDGRRMYVYSAGGGVAGVDAATGELLWHTDAWTVRIATIASPVVVGPGRLLLSGGYNAGSALMQIERDGDAYAAEILWRLTAEEFGATQHTPIFYRDHLFGVRPDGQLVCLDLDGRIRWTSGPTNRFGLGPFMIAGDLIYLMDDHGRLTLVEVSISTYKPLASARVLEGHESWGPLALAGDRLLVRDLTRVKCLHLGPPR